VVGKGEEEMIHRMMTTTRRRDFNDDERNNNKKDVPDRLCKTMTNLLTAGNEDKSEGTRDRVPNDLL
jgi:hypothetical protein